MTWIFVIDNELTIGDTHVYWVSNFEDDELWGEVVFDYDEDLAVDILDRIPEGEDKTCSFYVNEYRIDISRKVS